MANKHISIKTREARIERQRRYHYYSTTPLVNLIKPEYHQVFHQWYNNELRTFLKGADEIEFFEIYKFNFNLKPYGKDKSYSAFVFSLAKFLTEIGRDEGLMVSVSMIFRYITDKNHSNLPMAETKLKRLVYEAFSRNN